jgi:hypothetical protein
MADYIERHAANPEPVYMCGMMCALPSTIKAEDFDPSVIEHLNILTAGVPPAAMYGPDPPSAGRDAFMRVYKAHKPK